MNQTSPILRGRPNSARRRLAAPLLGLLAAAVVLLAPSLASADTASTLSVVGTSDVSDSGLMPNLIQPAFSAAFPQFTFKYTGSATGTAIGNAESGSGGPSVLIVHAASLENQFVAGGFSYNNQYGNAIFRNDYVLAGPTADATHANVAADGAHNIAQAFADIARAGAAVGGPNAIFFTRGGTTTAAGTVVAEHAYWQLVNSAGLTPAGVSLCNVSAADGGGMSPINTAVQATSGQPCPDSGTVSVPANLPAWYKINAGNQAANVIATNACTGTGVPANSCYSLTDRGTYDYLASGTDPAGTIPNLQIVTRDNSASAPGGINALINYFHAYIINPDKPGETVNLTAAQDFVNFLTSSAIQGQLKNYLPTVDPGGPPFVADAAPTITAAGFPSTAVTAGTPVTVAGKVINNELGYPAIAGKTVSVDQLGGLTPLAVASGTTDAAGNYSIKFTPRSSGSFQVSTGAISQIEDATLNPPYGDILSPGASAASSVAVNATAAITTTKTTPGSVTASGTLGPAAVDTKAVVTLLARKKSSTGAFRTIATQSVKAGVATFSVTGALANGAWTIEVQYSDPGAFNPATSATRNVTVPLAKGPKLGYKKLSVKRGTVTLSGTLGVAPKGTRGTVRLFAHVLNKLGHKGKKARFRQVAKVTIKAGKKTFTLKHKFKRGYRYVLKLQYTHAGQKTTNSKYRNVVVR